MIAEVKPSKRPKRGRKRTRSNKIPAWHPVFLPMVPTIGRQARRTTRRRTIESPLQLLRWHRPVEDFPQDGLNLVPCRILHLMRDYNAAFAALPEFRAKCEAG